MKGDDPLALLRKAIGSSPVTLICVSKQMSLPAMLKLYDKGVRDFGESRLQSALPKKKGMPEDVVWHYIGPIQSNKAKAIAASFDRIHSVASVSVAEIISRSALALGRKIPCFLQVNISGEKTKQGFSEAELRDVFPLLQKLEGISIQGLMTMAPHTEEKEVVRACFRSLALLRSELGLPFLSMGMSSDYLIALEEGSTHLRIGSYLLSGN